MNLCVLICIFLNFFLAQSVCVKKDNSQCSSVSVVLADAANETECGSFVEAAGFVRFSFGKNVMAGSCLAEQTDSNDCSEGFFGDISFTFYTTDDNDCAYVSADNGCATDTDPWSAWGSWSYCERPYPQGHHARTRSRTSDDCVQDDVQSMQCVPTAEPTLSPTYMPSMSPTGEPTILIDCMGVTDGTAYLDACSICVEGTSSLSDGDNQDCAGDCGGSAFLDSCGTCVGGSTGLARNATRDCADVCGGSAYINSCGVCVGGTTGLTHDEGKDCASICEGQSSNDRCNVCEDFGHYGRTSRHKDCAGVCFGSAILDACGACVQGTTGKVFNYLQDACGVCNGDNSTCIGCDNVAGSGQAFDYCDVCGGDNSCTAIVSVDPPVIEGGQTVLFTVNLQNSGITSSTTGTTCQLGTYGGSCHVLNPGDETVDIVATGPTMSTLTATHLFSIHDSGGVLLGYKVLTFYEAPISSISLSRPTSLTIGEDHLFTFSSSSFEPSLATGLSGNLVCKFGIHTGDVIVAATMGTGEANCTFPAQANSFYVKADLSFDGGTSAIHSEVFTAYSNAPQILRAQFSRNLNKILFTFDVDIEAADYDARPNCYSLMKHLSNGLIFGTSPVCVWLDWRTLELTMDSDAYVHFTPTWVVQPVTNALAKRGEAYPEYTTGFVGISASSDPISPSVIIHGPTVVSSCLATFTLDASYSTGHGSRAFTYLWSTTSAATIDADESHIVITTSELPVDQASEFSLQLTNWAGETTSAVVYVNVTSKTAISLLTLEGPQVITPSEAFTIYANADTCTSNELFYSWSVDDDTLSLAYTDQATLYVPAEILQSGRSYSFTVNVTDSDGDSVTGEFDLTVESSDIVAVIVGGSRTVNPSDPVFELDCLSESYDPDGALGTLRCDWTCEEGHGFCISDVDQSILPLGSGALSVDPSKLTAGKSYRFTAHVFKDGRESDAWVNITVSNDPLVSVTMSGPPIPQQVDRVNEIVAQFHMAGNLEYNWFCTDTREEDRGYVFYGGGYCADADGQELQKVYFTSATHDWCRTQCTGSIYCVGYTFSTTPNGECSLYGASETWQIDACNLYSCYTQTGSNSPIETWTESPYDAECYARATPLSYTNISSLTSSLLTHANGTQFSVLTIPSNTFQQGQIYFLKFTVTNGTFMGEAGWVISSLSVPSSGAIIVDGNAITASGWTHEYLPLEYEFSLVDSNSIAWALARQYHWLVEHSELPYGTQTLQVCASDRFGAKVEATSSFTESFDTSDHANLVSDLVSKPAAAHNWRALLYGIFVIQSFLSELSSELQTEYTSLLFDALTNHSSLHMDDANRLDLIGGIAKLDLSGDAYVDKIDALISLVSTIEIQNMKQILYRSGQLLAASEDHVDKIRAIDEKVLQLGLLTLQHEQDTLTFTTNHANLVMAWSLSSVLTSSFGGYDISLEFGPSFTSDFGVYDCGESTCFGVKISTLHYSTDIFTQSGDLWMQLDDAHLVSSIFKFVLANPSSNEYIIAQNLDTPIVVNFTLSEALNQTHYLYHCAVWDSGSERWASAAFATVGGLQASCALSDYDRSSSVLAIIARLKTPNPTPSPTPPPTPSPTECVQGGVTLWSEWSECVVNSNRTRYRSCSNPEPTCWWKNCTENLVDSQCCTQVGSYTEWSDWTDCNYRGDGHFGTGEYIFRNRTCLNPNPSCGGLNCTYLGEPEEWVYCGETAAPSTSPSVEPTRRPTFSPTSLPQGPCKEVGWGYLKDPNQVNGSCYYKSDYAMTRSDALTYCGQVTIFGGMLLAATTEIENLMAYSMCEVETPDNCWIGGTNQGWEISPGVYQAYDFENWHSSVTSVNDVEFVYFAKTTYGEWHSASDANQFHAICEVVFDGCMWPVVSNRLTWEKGGFGNSYTKSCSAGYVGSVTRECTLDGWLEAVDGCEIYFSDGVWTDDGDVDGYGWSNPAVTDGSHGPFEAGSNSTKTFSMNLGLSQEYIKVSFQFVIIQQVELKVWSGDTLLWTSPDTTPGSYTAEFVVSVAQLSSSGSFDLTFGSVASSRRILTDSGSASFANLTLSTMTREEVAQQYCVNTDAYKGGDYYVGFNHSQSGFGSSSQAGSLKLVLDIPRYFYDLQIGFENALDEFGGYNASREYPQINASDPTLDRTYWTSDRTASEICGDEVWTAEIPVTLQTVRCFLS